jgi:hypothetical protein
MAGQAETKNDDPIERMLWLWSLDAAGRMGPDAFKLLTRSNRHPTDR